MRAFKGRFTKLGLLGEYKRLQAELIQAKTFAQNLIQTANAMIIGLDPVGKVTVFNEAAQRITGYSWEEVANRDCFELIVPRDRFPQVWEQFQNGFPREYENPILTKSGEERHILWQNSDPGQQGSYFGTLSFGIDITQRKKALSRIQEREAFLDTLIQTIPIPVFHKDREGRYTGFNKAFEAFFGAEQSQMIGRTLHDLHPKELADLYQAQDEDLFQKGGIQRYEAAVQTRGLGRREVIFTKALFHGPEGKVGGLVGAIQDITEKKQRETALRASQSEARQLLEISDRSRTVLLSLLEDEKEARQEIHQLNTQLEQRVADRTAELEAANRELEAFAYSVSHDLRAPLRHMVGFLDLLATRLGPDLETEAAHYLQIARQASTRMGQLIDDLLAFSRLGRTELLRVPFDARELLSRVISELPPGRPICMKVGDLPALFGDPRLMYLVFQNLLNNALKFTRNQPEPLIEIEPILGLEGESGLFVRDNGVGFDPTHAHKLFGVFQRLHREAEFEGTGIGLANVHRIITRHGGRVWAEGKLGQGAIFYITLPNPTANT